MKKTALCLLTLATLCLSAETQPHVLLQDLTNEELSSMMQGEHPELTLELSKGSLLPIHFFLNGDLVELKDAPSRTVELQQTFYAHVTKEGLWLSSDQLIWKPFLEFITGTLSVQLTIRDRQPTIVFGSETYRKT